MSSRFIDPYTYRLMGKPIQHFVEVAHVMGAHDIETAKELNDKLGAVKWPRIKVVDSCNRSRLLGTLKRPEEAPRGPRLRMVVMEQLRWRDEWFDTPVVDQQVNSIDFEIVELRKGWDIELALATSDHLNLLLELPEFRLPGETASQAKRRWEQATFG